MRRALLFIALSFSTSAQAMVPVGAPPWYCTPAKVCNDENLCLNIYFSPSSFKMSRVGKQKDKFIIEGLRGRERTAIVLPSIEGQESFLQAELSKDQAPIILVPNNDFGDALGFWVYQFMVSRRNGEISSKKERLLVVCKD